MVYASISGHKIGIKNGLVIVKCQSGKTLRRHVKTILKDAELFCSACGITPDPFALIELVSDAAGLVSESFECD